VVVAVATIGLVVSIMTATGISSLAACKSVNAFLESIIQFEKIWIFGLHVYSSLNDAHNRAILNYQRI